MLIKLQSTREGTTTREREKERERERENMTELQSKGEKEI